MAGVTVEEDPEFGKDYICKQQWSTCNAGGDTWAGSPLRHLSSAKHGQAIPSAPSSCLKHIPAHPLLQHGCTPSLSPKSRKTQLLTLT